MTRADKIKEYVKKRYGVEINETSLEQSEFNFQGCDGFECPPECIIDDFSSLDCSKCKYNEFWEQEDRPRNKTKEKILREREEMRKRGGL